VRAVVCEHGTEFSLPALAMCGYQVRRARDSSLRAAQGALAPFLSLVNIIPIIPTLCFPCELCLIVIITL
jgi:hypothetical protein